MVIVSFNHRQVGVVKGDLVFDVSPAVPGAAGLPDRMLPVVARFEELRHQFEETVARGEGIPLAQVRLRPPLIAPSKILCAFANYERHSREMSGGASPPSPELFLKSPAAIIGPGDYVELPDIPASAFHHECELAVVIKKPTKKARPEEAMDSVFGYAAFIDVSARGLPDRVSQFRGKSFDTFAPLGPALVTSDEVGDPHNLTLRLWVNDELRQEASTRDMVHNIPTLIAYASSVTTLLPGDIIATGTPEGVGPIQPGDRITIEIEKVGRMTVGVSAASNNLAGGYAPSR